MIIYHDTSYVKPSNAKWIAKGYAMEDIYSLRLQFLYTEAQQEENRMAHAAGIRDTVQLRQAAEHRNAVMAPIMAAIALHLLRLHRRGAGPLPQQWLGSLFLVQQFQQYRTRLWTLR